MRATEKVAAVAVLNKLKPHTSLNNLVEKAAQ